MYGMDEYSFRGRRYTEQCAELVLAHGGHLSWVDRCRYLGRCAVHSRLFA